MSEINKDLEELKKELLLSDEDLMIAICGDCQMEKIWNDTDCRVCKGNMNYAIKVQLDKLLSHPRIGIKPKNLEGK